MKFLITSANSYGNVGDDICGYSAGHLAALADPSAEVTVTCPPFREELAAQADVIVLGGGGIIYDTDPANVDNYLRYLEYAQAHGKVSAALGLGVQGITTPEGKRRYRDVLSKTDVVTVRSPVDERLLRDIGVDKAVATQDLGFAADEWVRPAVWWRRFGSGLPANGKPNLGLAVVDLVAMKGDRFDEKSANFKKSLEDNLPRLCREFNVYLLVHSRDDAVWYKKLSANYGLRVLPYAGIRDFPRFWRAYQQLDLVVGVRFHSIILGLLAGKPVIGVGSQSTKQNRLANYDMPTLKRQFVLLSDIDGIGGLFTHLRERFDAGDYIAAGAAEMENAKRKLHQNAELLRAVLPR